MNTLFVNGLPNDNTCKKVFDKKGNSKTILTGTCNLRPFLPHFPGEKHSLLMTGNGPSQPFNIPFWPNVIFNEISDPDTHTIALKRCKNFVETQDCDVINHPARIEKTKRNLIYQKLHHIDGLDIPKTISFKPQTPDDVKNALEENNFEYPVLLRQAGDHGGISTSIIDNHEKVIETLYKYALDGREYYLTQFVDYKSADNNYRKYRVVVIDGEAYIRHLIISDNCIIHSSSRKFMEENPEFNQEEEAFLSSFQKKLTPKISKIIKVVSDELGLDYFGIDCNIDEDGNILIFEINANMNIMTNSPKSPNRWEKPIALIGKKVTEMIIRHAQARMRSKQGSSSKMSQLSISK